LGRRQAGAQARDYSKLFIATVIGGLHNSWPRRSRLAADDEI
jgi:hypothetical protein